MSILTLIILLFIISIITLVVRSTLRIYKRTLESPQPKFPIFSISMLTVSLILLVIGIWISLQVSDALGGAIGALGGFFGTLESYVRHKRDAVLKNTFSKKEVL